MNKEWTPENHDAWIEKHQDSLEKRGEDGYERSAHARIVEHGTDWMLQATMMGHGGWCNLLRMNYDVMKELGESMEAAINKTDCNKGNPTPPTQDRQTLAEYADECTKDRINDLSLCKRGGICEHNLAQLRASVLREHQAKLLWFEQNLPPTIEQVAPSEYTAERALIWTTGTEYHPQASRFGQWGDWTVAIWSPDAPVDRGWEAEIIKHNTLWAHKRLPSLMVKGAGAASAEKEAEEWFWENIKAIKDATPEPRSLTWKHAPTDENIDIWEGSWKSWKVAVWRSSRAAGAWWCYRISVDKVEIAGKTLGTVYGICGEKAAQKLAERYFWDLFPKEES